MTDVMTAEQRSRVMSRNRGKNTSPERYVHELAEAAGLSFLKHEDSLPGKPDLVFGEQRLAVFIDGDFWHGWRFPIWEHRLSEFWREKIRKNRERDRRNFRKLRRMGWRVLRLWEHQVEVPHSLFNRWGGSLFFGLRDVVISHPKMFNES